MKYQDWLNTLLDKRLICEHYTPKVESAGSKAQLMRLFLDANGVPFFCEMASKGYAMPYETLLNDFPRFVNGNYIAEYKNEKGNGYTSCFYCCYTEEDSVTISTTQTLFLGCKLDIYIKPNDFVQIYADRNCELNIHCPKSARCLVNYWKGAKISVADMSLSNVKLTEEV